MCNRQGSGQIFQAGSVGGVKVAAESVHPGFVKGHPVFYFATEMGSYFIRIIAKAIDAVVVGETALFLKRLRKIPMKKRNPGSYPFFKAEIKKPVVKIQPFLVDLSRPGRENPGPGDGTAVIFHSQATHQFHIFPVAVVMIAGNIAGFAVGGVAFFMGKNIPNAFSPAVLVYRALNLI